MLAVDTNVIVRYLTGDDPAQFARASALLREEMVYVCATVLLETEWVLRGAYGFTRNQVVEALAAFAGLPHVILEDPALIAKAIQWMADGMDFADALHFARTQHCEVFVTFDRRFAAAAASVREATVRLL